MAQYDTKELVVHENIRSVKSGVTSVIHRGISSACLRVEMAQYMLVEWARGLIEPIILSGVQ